MIDRRQFVLGLAVAVAMGTPVQAKEYADQVLAQLERQGYRIVTQGRTFLGRVRIVAQKGEGQREIVLNPRTGEILRDIWSGGENSLQTAILPRENDSRSGTSGNGRGDGGGGSGGGESGGDDHGGDDDGGED